MTREDCYKSLLNTKVFVKDKSTSIQCILFSLGFEWNGGRSSSSLVSRTDAPFLFMSEDGKITCSNSTNHFYSMNNKEVSAEYILSMKYIDEGLSVPYLSSWIDVNKDMPYNHEELIMNDAGFIYEYGSTYLLFCIVGNSYCTTDLMIKDENGNWNWRSGNNVTHWMPIPPYK